MPGDSIKVQRPVVTGTRSQAAQSPSKGKAKKVTVPVGQKKTPQAKTSQQEWGLDRVKKVYREKGFWAAVGQYFKEAFCGPDSNASNKEIEAYNMALAINEYNLRK